MYKKDLQKCIEKEILICKRLFSKIPKDKFDYTPKEGMRTMFELLQYLSTCGYSMFRFWAEGKDLSMKDYFADIRAKAQTMQPEEFPARMDEQLEIINNIFESLTDEDLLNKEAILPWGEKMNLGQAVMESSLKWLSTYKYQLFMYIKLSSDQKLVTPDAWVITEMDQ